MAHDVDAIHVDGGEGRDEGLDLLEVFGVPEPGGLRGDDVGGEVFATLFFGELFVPVF
jgi:hypothetical protein